MDEATNRAIWDVLVKNANARENQWDEFNHHFPKCREFRFMGSLGLGGKVWAPDGRTPVRVSCYQEDENRERRATVERTNKALENLAIGSVR